MSAITGKILGSATIEPSAGDVPWPIDLAAVGSFSWRRAESVLIDASEGSPYPIAPPGDCHLVAIRAPAGSSFRLIVTSPVGSQQKFPFSESFMTMAPAESPFSSVGVSGQGRIEYLTAGN